MKIAGIIFSLLLLTPVFAAADEDVKTQIEKTLVAAANGKHSSFDYHKVKQLSPKLADDISKQYTDSAIKECGKNYKKSGEVCGYDFDPITCAQDFDKPSIISLKEDNGVYQAEVNWLKESSDSRPVAYRFVKQNGQLAIDAITCRFDDNSTIKFNW